jgi:hypothetical protein
MTFEDDHRIDAGHRAPAGTGTDGADWAWSLSVAERACCCAARPAVAAVLPPTPDRPYPMDLLLCRHHFRRARNALAAAAAVVYDESGALVGSDGPAYVPDPAIVVR